MDHLLPVIVEVKAHYGYHASLQHFQICKAAKINEKNDLTGVSNSGSNSILCPLGT